MSNKKIINATKCKNSNIWFKSVLEKTIYNTLIKNGINPSYEPTTFTLWEGFIPITPFYDQETPEHQKKRIAKGDTTKNKILVEKAGKVVGIRYTPDFYFRYGDLDVYIEAKGFENDVFYIKKKLFRYYLDNKLKETGQHSIFIEVYTRSQMLQALQIIKEYELSTRNKETTVSSS